MQTPQTKAGKQAKIRRVLHEFKTGTLQSSAGPKVTDRNQAIAIALSEAGLSKRAKPGGGGPKGVLKTKG